MRSPYLTAFGTISSLYKDSCQFSFEKQRWERLVHACQISDGGCYSQLSIIYLQRGRHHFRASYLMTGFIAYIRISISQKMVCWAKQSKETYNCNRFRVLHHRNLHEPHHSDTRYRIPSQTIFSSLLSTTSTYSLNCLVSLPDV